MKFSVSMYSYMQKIRSGEATPFELIAKTKELGFDAIEFVDFTDFGTGTKEERLAHAEELRKECERVGLEISALVMSCDFITGSGTRQHGEDRFRLAASCRDTALIEESVSLARAVIDRDPTLSAMPAIRLQLDRLRRERRAFSVWTV